MTMPKRLTMVRHGQSEANVAQKSVLTDLDPEVEAAIYARPDWMQRLSPLGIEQAKIAGDWIRANIGALATYDVIYVSPFMRTFETACYAAGNEDVQLTFEDRIIERDWGLYGKLTRKGQEETYPETHRNKKDNPLYARLDGGESFMDVYSRIRDFHSTLHREQEEGRDRVLAFTHGDLMTAERYVNERMLPENFMAMVRNPQFDFRNGSVLDWSRENPNDPEDVRGKYNWMRIVHPIAPELSPYGGGWVELNKKRTYSVREGLARVAQVPNLLSPDMLEALERAEAVKRAADNETFAITQ